MWVWQARWFREAESRTALLDFCETHGFNLLLVQVHLTQDAEDRVALRYPAALKALVVEAAARDIAVEALDGAPDMAMKANWPRTLAILDLVLAFNESLPDDAKLAGIHYDIEPYITDAWKQGGEQRQTIMVDLLAYYDEARARIAQQQGDAFLLAADIPFWYDNKTSSDDSCIVTYKGQTKNLHQHIQDICDYVGIMSYRRRAEGRSGVLDVVANELAYAEEIGKFITPALETIELEDTPQITFFDTSAAEFWRVHQAVRDALGDHPAFGGMLTHSYRGLRDLLEPDTPTP